jgi:hypothetical protein
LTQNPLQFVRAAFEVITRCKRCRFTSGGQATYYGKGPGFTYRGMPAVRTYEVYAVTQGVLWVPGDGFLWVCSRSVTHAIDAHGFTPPHEFCQAVLRCPPMRSTEYREAVLSNGGRELNFDK